jgi:anthranilate synthase component 1
MAIVTPESAFAAYPLQLPADALLQLHAANPSRYPVLLQSAAHGEPLGRYDILFAFPQSTLSLRGGVLSGAEHGEHFLAALDRQWRQQRLPASDSTLPFTGGWFVFLSYEFAQQVEPILSLPRDESQLIAHAMRIPAAIVVRHEDNSAWLVAEHDHALACAAVLQQVQSDIDSLQRSPAASFATSLLASELSEDTPQRYLDATERVLEHIRAGDVYQANLSRGWRARMAAGVQPHHIYERLRRTNPAPFAALAVLDDMAIVSSTPERLIEVRDRNVSTRPIAGTRPRTLDRSDDAERLRELHSHPKERAEHVMLIDLERNDLGRICEAGSVRVSEFMTLESYQHVHHIVSNIEGRLRGDVTPGQALAAVFPGGTITGCPKVRCMQIIGELEGEPRGAYTGSMGYINRDGSMDFNILIRTLELRDGSVTFRAGAGIVADSTPLKELDETRAKARGLVRALVEGVASE